MEDFSIKKIRQSTYVTISMIALCAAGVASWIFLLGGTAAVESEYDSFDVGFSWWLMIYCGALYILAFLAWILSMSMGVSLFKALANPLALMFAVAFAWSGVELRSARRLTGEGSESDAWFVGLFFTSIVLVLFMIFFSTWDAVVNLKIGKKVQEQDQAVQQKAAHQEAVYPGHIPAPPGAAAIIAQHPPPGAATMIAQPPPPAPVYYDAVPPPQP